MKSFVLCLLVLTAMLFCSAPAQAGHFENRVVGVDFNGNPLVAQVFVQDFNVSNGIGLFGTNAGGYGGASAAFFRATRFNDFGGHNSRFRGEVVRGRRGGFVVR